MVMWVKYTTVRAEAEELAAHGHTGNYALVSEIKVNSSTEWKFLLSVLLLTAAEEQHR